MEGSSSHHFQNQHRVLGFGTINFGDYLGLGVSGSKNPYQNVEGGPMMSKQSYPVRPEADNCFYFMNYGWCKFGSTCRYNHPFNQLIEANKEIMMPGEENLTRMERLECKYYPKLEEACGYDHSGRKIVVAPSEFNLLGLPIRPGVTACPYYMRNGSCKYGISCWFDHSDPLSMGGAFPLYGYTGEYTFPPWSLAGPVNEICPSDPYMYAPFDPYMYPPEEISPYSERSGYQVPEQWSQSTPSAFSMKSAAASAKPFQPNQPEVLTKESLKLVEQPEGNLKFGVGFHHPGTSSCKVVPPAVSEEAKVPAAAAAAGSQEARAPPAGSQEALPPQLPDPTTQDKN